MGGRRRLRKTGCRRRGGWDWLWRGKYAVLGRPPGSQSADFDSGHFVSKVCFNKVSATNGPQSVPRCNRVYRRLL
eukprot:3576981-Rhodomonas_salina.4